MHTSLGRAGRDGKIVPLFPLPVASRYRGFEGEEASRRRRLTVSLSARGPAVPPGGTSCGPTRGPAHVLVAPGAPQRHGDWTSEGPAREARRYLGKCRFCGWERGLYLRPGIPRLLPATSVCSALTFQLASRLKSRALHSPQQEEVVSEIERSDAERGGLFLSLPRARLAVSRLRINVPKGTSCAPL